MPSTLMGEGMARSEFDVIIVGGGPAGLCAAMYAGRGLLHSVLIERGVPGGELLNTEWIDDYPGFEHVLGRQLADLMTAHAVKFGADIRQDTVESIVRGEDEIFQVTTGLGQIYRAPAVVLTSTHSAVSRIFLASAVCGGVRTLGIASNMGVKGI